MFVYEIGEERYMLLLPPIMVGLSKDMLLCVELPDYDIVPKVSVSNEWSDNDMLH